MDLNGEKQQLRSGTIPSGSSVLVKMTIIKPKHHTSKDEYISQSQTGLKGIFVQYDVIAGSYINRKIFENIWLPPQAQDIELSEGQFITCDRGGRRLRAILEAAKNILPSNEGKEANAERILKNMQELNNLIFPIQVALDPKPSEKNGIAYWNNTISRIITPDMDYYMALMEGGEKISNGPICCYDPLIKNKDSQVSDEISPDEPT